MRLVVCLVLAALAPTFAQAGPELERVVMVSRHGVRAPIKTVEALEAMTHRAWPKWPVAAGEMTAHGARDLTLMADYLRQAYVAKGALPATGCPATDAVDVWSDVADNRTRQSGEIFAAHLAPGCSLVSRHAADGTVDPLFDATKTHACPIGILSSSEALVAATKGQDLLTPSDRRAFDTIQGIMAPEACGSLAKGICIVPDAEASRARIVTDMTIGATVAEALYLEYEQGFPVTDIGWGKAATPATMAEIMPLHGHGAAILRRTPLLAARRGAVMAETIVALLKGSPLPKGAPPLATGANVVMIAGHDSNLLYMAGLMGLDWTLPDQPSVTAPDTTLAFEVWRDAKTQARTLKVVIYSQTLADLRDETPLNASHPPGIVPIVPAACAGTTCDLATFTADVTEKLGALCRP